MRPYLIVCNKLYNNSTNKTGKCVLHGVVYKITNGVFDVYYACF
jgi:hypothetical protein